MACKQFHTYRVKIPFREKQVADAPIADLNNPRKNKKPFKNNYFHNVLLISFLLCFEFNSKGNTFFEIDEWMLMEMWQICLIR